MPHAVVFSSFGAGVLAFWLLVYAVNKLLVDYASPRVSRAYSTVLSKSGVSVTPLQVRWQTARCNRLMIRLANKLGHTFLKHWFNAGVAFGLCGQLASVAFLLYTLVYTFAQPQANVDNQDGNNNNHRNHTATNSNGNTIHVATAAAAARQQLLVPVVGKPCTII